MPEIVCERLIGGSVKFCACRLPIGADRKGGWLECPPEARGLLEPVPVARKPAPRSDGIVEPVGFDRRRYAMADALAVGETVAPVASILSETVTRAAPEPTRPPRPPVRLSGDICEFCGSPNLQWSGTCKLCRDCGSSAGGCS